MIEPLASLDECRAITRSWLDENLPSEWTMSSADPHAVSGWFSKLGDAGLATPTWPVEHGGLGLSPEQAAVINEEVSSRGAARPAVDFVGLVLAGPTLLQWATDEQKERLLKPLARAEHFWCQLFSEPGAGSDLAGLSTRAEQAPEGSWRINGQKVWSSLASQADYGLLLTRSDPAAPKHQGITAFALDMRLPGVEVRPLRQMTGEHEFDEVFFTDVVIPDDMRLGPVNEGWRVAVSTLMAERNGLSGQPAVGAGRSDELVARALQTGAWEDPRLRDDLVSALVEERALEMTNLRAFVALQSGVAGAGGSVTKLVQSELLQRLSVLQTDIEQTKGVAWSSDDSYGAEAAHAFLYSRAYTIAGGTSEIQRNIIAERVLGLPKG